MDTEAPFRVKITRPNISIAVHAGYSKAGAELRATMIARNIDAALSTEVWERVGSTWRKISAFSGGDARQVAA